MNIQIQSLKFDADKKLLDYIEKKVSKLQSKFERVVDAEVILRLNNQGVDNKTVEIILNVPGNKIFSKEKASTFEKGTDDAVQSIQRQLEKFKTKIRAH